MATYKMATRQHYHVLTYTWQTFKGAHYTTAWTYNSNQANHMARTFSDTWTKRGQAKVEVCFDPHCWVLSQR